jgi:hypothetical protein
MKGIRTKDGTYIDYTEIERITDVMGNRTDKEIKQTLKQRIIDFMCGEKCPNCKEGRLIEISFFPARKASCPLCKFEKSIGG